MSVNPNTITAGIREVWDNMYQVTHHKVPTYPAFSNFRLAAGLQKGDTVNRQYRSTLVANDMDGDGGYNRQALTDTNEQLSINKEKEVSFYIKKLDEIQNHLPTRARYAEDSSIALFNQIDGDILGNYDQYTNTLDDGDLGGTAGNGITVNTSNVRKLFSQSLKLLQRGSIKLDLVAKFSGVRKEDASVQRGVAIISPDVYATLLESLDGKDSSLGDSVGINGHTGRYFGFDLFVSNGIGWSGTLDFTTIPVAGDTIVINGVTLTAAADGAATNAGDFSIQTTNDLAAAELVKLINGTGTAGADSYIDVSTANRALLKNITATYDSSTNLLTLKATGRGYITVSETLTPAGNVWTPAKQIQHCLIGVNNSIDVVIQKQPSVEIKPRDGKVGNDVVTWAAYGYKVFNEHKAKMIDVWVRTDAY
jgi:hypothetical protein